MALRGGEHAVTLMGGADAPSVAPSPRFHPDAVWRGTRALKVNHKRGGPATYRTFQVLRSKDRDSTRAARKEDAVREARGQGAKPRGLFAALARHGEPRTEKEVAMVRYALGQHGFSLVWTDPAVQDKSVWLRPGVQVRSGVCTPAMERHVLRPEGRDTDPSCCVSLITSERTVDIVFDEPAEAAAWATGRGRHAVVAAMIASFVGTGPGSGPGLLSPAKRKLGRAGPECARAFLVAVRHGHAKAASELLYLAKRTKSVAQLLSLEDDRESNRTPLLLAAARLHTDVVSALLGVGARPTVVDADGRSALHLCCRALASQQQREFRRASSPLRGTCEGGSGALPLPSASGPTFETSEDAEGLLLHADAGAAGVVIALRESMQDSWSSWLELVAAADVAGDSALHIAAKHNLTDCCLHMTEGAAEYLAITDAGERTPADVAERAGHLELAGVLRSFAPPLESQPSPSRAVGAGHCAVAPFGDVAAGSGDGGVGQGSWPLASGGEQAPAAASEEYTETDAVLGSDGYWRKDGYVWTGTGWEYDQHGPPPEDCAPSHWQAGAAGAAAHTEAAGPSAPVQEASLPHQPQAASADTWTQEWATFPDGKQRPYYVNASTGEASWEHPSSRAGARAVVVVTHSGASDFHVPAGAGPRMAHVGAAGTTAAAAPAPAGPSADDPALARFKRMLKMGVPAGAVRAKLVGEEGMSEEAADRALEVLSEQPAASGKAAAETTAAAAPAPAGPSADDPALARFKRMLKMGVPAGAVRAKLVGEEGMSEEAADRALEVLSEQPAASGKAAAETTAAAAPAPAGPSADDPALARFKRMLKMGVPAGAVRAKLVGEEGMSEEAADRALEVLSEQPAASGKAAAETTAAAAPAPAGPSADDPALARFKRMLKMGVPAGAVRAKLVGEEGMSEEAADRALEVLSGQPAASGKAAAETTAAVAPAPAGPSADDPALARFKRMLKMGVPAGAVRAKLVGEEGMSEEAADRALEVLSGQASGSGAPAASGGTLAAEQPSQPRPPTLAELADDPVLGRFAKMNRMGVPALAVQAKMKETGLSEDQQRPLLQAMGLAGAVTGAAPPRKGVPPPRPPTAAERAVAEGRRLRALHWETVNQMPAQLLEKSVFAQVAGEAEAEESPKLGQDDLEELACLFAVAGKPKATGFAAKGAGARAGGRKGAGGPAAKAGASRLDAKRVNNVAIGLAQFRKLTPPKRPPTAAPGGPAPPAFRFAYQRALLAAILRGDEAAVPPARLEPLTVLMPSAAEAKAVSAPPLVPDQLAEADLFMWRCTLVPRLPAKLRALVTLHQAAAAAAEGVASCRTLTSACGAITGSAGLRKLVGLVLAVGNAMNRGTAKGDAVGFRLDALLKLRSTKAGDGKTTLLDYVTTTLLRQDEEVAQGVAAALAEADGGRRVLLSELRSRSQQLRADVRAAQTEADREEADVAKAEAEAEAAASSAAAKPGADSADAAAPGPAAATPPPAGGDPMAALLASIRSRGARKGAGSAGAGKPKAQGAASRFPYELPTLADRRAFPGVVRAKLPAAIAEAERLEASVKEAEEAAVTLAEFFAEDPASTTPEHVLSVLASFAAMYRASLATAMRKARAAAKRQ
ncbi:hypothetical protein FNF29_05120 [Cafeteria roenbergensis]|uniref:Formin-like protein n=2 Tax=Cafeteria roenbergensis TaxID=33653 RepID=A0A5A8CC95_CAFRO|nr:hypothetical protein FNF29_05120 [Cafeteria roenbergensis]|eukprot:KAA0150545.1 hypothetical protein FNF29_05120 [Cafeteria roenbergensis]